MGGGALRHETILMFEETRTPSIEEQSDTPTR
jgi:hypothetical protein